MSLIPYQANTLSEQASHEEASVGTTSSQILISREIADANSTVTSPELPASIPVTSILESSTQHIMTLGEAADLTSTHLPSRQDIDLKTEICQAEANNVEQNPSTRESICEESFKSALSTQPSPTRTIPASDSEHCIPNGLYNFESAERGRTLDKGRRYVNPLSRAESRDGKVEAIIELNPVPIGKRVSRSSTLFDDPTHPSAILDDNLLEPCPHPSPCANVSEVLVESPGEIPLSLLGSDNTLDYEPIISVSFENPLLDIPRLEIPRSLAPLLPTETIQQIYYNLLPADFNSARHTCRSWFINSLERPLLNEMLRRGGFSSSMQTDLTNNHVLSLSRTMVNEEWLMSKRLCREWALGPDWKGNGIDKQESETCSAFSKIATVNFAELSSHSNSKKLAGTLFNVSSCGKFLIAANGCLIYIYELNKKSTCDGHEPGSLRPITSIICPARVLACSIDTSSRRYAVAVLMDGRMGMVADITSLKMKARMERRNSPRPDTHNSPSSSFQASARLNSASFLERVSLNNAVQSPSQPFVFPGIAPTGLRDESQWQDVLSGDMTHSAQTSGPSSRHGSLSRLEILKQSRADKLPAVSLEDAPSRFGSFIPIENGPRSYYRNICSDDDPPRSVAICPQRRCVAFGCSGGIELHWVDALTGQDLNRWFPLTSPSDFLFFLPPRKSIDSAKKLRLISSAARPSERPAIAAKAFGGHSQSSPFWQRFGWGQNPDELAEHGIPSDRTTRTMALVSGLNSATRLNGRPESSDHYRAIPLSDGHHILFTDPASGILCLGSDAPVGSPSKLLRKIWFEGPPGEGSPMVYASGSDLSWGVRVIAAYGKGAEQSIWLFSVPLDIFNGDWSGPAVPSGPVLFKSRPNRERHTGWLPWWPENGAKEWLSHAGIQPPGFPQNSVWPVKIRGQEVGRCSGVVDLAIDSGPNMTIWAFGKDGISTVWRIKDGRVEIMKERLVIRDGTLRQECNEGEFDMVATDHVELSGLNAAPGQVESFDGTVSLDGLCAMLSSMPATATRKSKRQTPSNMGAIWRLHDGWFGNH